MKPVIAFILPGTSMRAFKRIDSFIKEGYNVKVFSFDRGEVFPVKKEGIDVHIIGSFSSDLPYNKRISLFIAGLRKAFKQFSPEQNVCWYYFGLPVCFFGFLLNRSRLFVYEESDMTHLNIKNKLTRYLAECVDRFLIKRATVSLLTSEGFVNYHFGGKNVDDNIVVIPNKLRKDVTTIEDVLKTKRKNGSIRFGFVGFIRYASVYNISEVISRVFPNHEVHFYGIIYETSMKRQFESLSKRDNVFFHGGFKNPDDLANIYANIDVLICTYDNTSVNAQYAEPNKLYESIYFRTPIIVSKDTFLASQVEKLNCGYVTDAFDEQFIIKMVNNIQINLKEKQEAISCIPKEHAIDDATILFEKMNEKIGI